MSLHSDINFVPSQGDDTRCWVGLPWAVPQA